MAVKTVIEGSSVTAAQLKDLFRQIDGGNIGSEEMQAILEHRNPWPDRARDFPVWKTVKLGTCKTPGAYLTALTKGGCRISDWANDILNKVVVSPTEMELDLVVLSVAELGFKDDARYDAICARAKELGLDLCPAEVGSALRLAYGDQPKGEWLLIAMEPLTDSGGVRRIFYVAHGHDDLWLLARYDYPGDVWRAGNRFVFERRS